MCTRLSLSNPDGKLSLFEQDTNEVRRLGEATTATTPTAAEMRRTLFNNGAVPSGTWGAALVRNETRMVTSVFEAQFAINSNPWSPSCDVDWFACLTGAWILTPEAFIGRGASVRYHAAVLTKRFVWVSQAARDAHPGLWRCILESLNAVANHKWTLLPSAERFCEEKAKAERAKRSPQVIALCAAGEGNGLPHVFQHAAFLDFIKKPDVARTSLGIAML